MDKRDAQDKNEGKILFLVSLDPDLFGRRRGDVFVKSVCFQLRRRIVNVSSSPACRAEDQPSRRIGALKLIGISPTASAIGAGTACHRQPPVS